MMRGYRKFAEICNTLSPPEHPEQQQPAITLNEQRDQLLILRYVHYLEQKKQYREILITLRDEYFISAERIADIISNHIDQIRSLRANPPKKTFLKETYPHLIW